MHIRRVAVKNIRSHEDKVVDLSSSTTVLAGSNGAGKTSLLEAVYIGLQGTSFKGSFDDVLRHDTPWWRIDLLLDDETTRSITYDPTRTSGKRQYTINEKKSHRLAPKDKYPVVLFEPEDLRLLHGSPSRRRQFIDHILLQLDPTYSTTLRKYERALKQRNTLLKSGTVSKNDLFVWNITLSEYGAEIIKRRVYATEILNSSLNDHYRNIAQTADTVAVHYSHTSIDNSSQKLLQELETRVQYDMTVQYTSVGPHRHDIKFLFNDSPALSVASRGEVRSVVLAIKRIEIEMIHKLVGLKPIVLLDDVFSDLDASRQEGLLQDDNSNPQTIITATHLPLDAFATVIKL